MRIRMRRDEKMEMRGGRRAAEIVWRIDGERRRERLLQTKRRWHEDK